MTRGEGGAIGSLGSAAPEPVDVVVGAAVITDGGVASEQAGRPVRIPVVIERAADAPGRRQLDATGTGGTLVADSLRVSANTTGGFGGDGQTFGSSPVDAAAGGAATAGTARIATSNVAVYGSVGGELGVGRVGVRLEVRDYATGFKPLVGAGRADTRNDVVIMVGLRFNRHHQSQD